MVRTKINIRFVLQCPALLLFEPDRTFRPQVLWAACVSRRRPFLEIPPPNFPFLSRAPGCPFARARTLRTSARPQPPVYLSKMFKSLEHIQIHELALTIFLNFAKSTKSLSWGVLGQRSCEVSSENNCLFEECIKATRVANR